VPAVNALVTVSRQIGSALEAGGALLLHRLMPYIQNPFLIWRKLGPKSRSAEQRGDCPYDADAYRLPIGMTILWIAICFTLAVLYTLRHRPAV
jgi:hypothetical protein